MKKPYETVRFGSRWLPANFPNTGPSQAVCPNAADNLNQRNLIRSRGDVMGFVDEVSSRSPAELKSQILDLKSPRPDNLERQTGDVRG